MKKSIYLAVIGAIQAGYSTKDVAAYVLKNHPSIFLKAVGADTKPTISYFVDGVEITPHEKKMMEEFRNDYKAGRDKVQCIKGVREIFHTDRMPYFRPSLRWAKDYIEGTEEIEEQKH